MKTLKLLIAVFVLLFSLIEKGVAQDVIYSQFYANPMYLNPALTGSKACQRITLNYRNQWPGIQKGFLSYNASWDQYFPKLSGAVGIIVNSDIEGGGIYTKLNSSGIYTYHLQATKDLEFMAAIQAGYIHYRLDWSKLVFGSMIDIGAGQEIRENIPPKLSIGNIDFSAGLLAGYKKSLYFGVAANHLSQPDISFYNQDINRLQLRWTVHAGMLIDVVEGMEGDNIKNLAFSPNVVYVQQGKFRQLNAGMYVNFHPFVGGLWLRHNFGNPDAAILLFCFQQNNYKIGYSFDYTISRLTVKSGGAHEFSLAWLFNKNNQRVKIRGMRHPDF